MYMRLSLYLDLTLYIHICMHVKLNDFMNCNMNFCYGFNAHSNSPRSDSIFVSLKHRMSGRRVILLFAENNT